MSILENSGKNQSGRSVGGNREMPTREDANSILPAKVLDIKLDKSESFELFNLCKNMENLVLHSRRVYEVVFLFFHL